MSSRLRTSDVTTSDHKISPGFLNGADVMHYLTKYRKNKEWKMAWLEDMELPKRKVKEYRAACTPPLIDKQVQSSNRQKKT
jgi:hypothetical protein